MDGTVNHATPEREGSVSGNARIILLIGLVVIGVTILFPPWTASTIRYVDTITGLSTLSRGADARQEPSSREVGGFKYSLFDPPQGRGWKVDVQRLIPFVAIEAVGSAVLLLLVGMKRSRRYED